MSFRWPIIFSDEANTHYGHQESEIIMNVKNILIILVAIGTTFIYPEVTLWLVPLTISITVLVKFRKIEIAKYIGLLSIKPVFIMLLTWLASYFGFLEPLYSLYPDEVVFAIFEIVPELILTLVIVYSFKHLFGTDKLIWLFLIGDIIRWSSLFAESLVTDPIPEPYFYTQFYVWVFFLLIFPPLYAMVGFISVNERILSENGAH